MSRSRLFAAAAAALLALGVTACQQDDDGLDPATTIEGEEEQPVPGEEGAPEPSPSPGVDDAEDAEAPAED